MPAQQESWIATAYLETGTITRGYVACLNAEGTKYVVSSAANRTAEGRRSACIALTSADADDPGGSSFEAQYVGVVPPSISGLGAGAESLIRVSSTGVLERVGEYSTSDDVCGHCDTDGTAYVCFPLVGLGAALGASSAPGLPARSIQYYLDANTLGGAAHAGISTDGYIESGTAPFPTTGTHRFSSGSSETVRNGQNTQDLTVWRHEYTSGHNIIVAGVDSGYTNNDAAKEVSDWEFFGHYSFYVAAGGPTGGSSYLASQLLVAAPGTFPALGSERFVFLQPTLLIGRKETITNSLNAGTDPTGGQLGGIVMSVLETGATPAAGFVSIYPDSSTGHLMQKLHDGTVFDLTDTGSGEGTFATVTSTGTIPDVDVTGVRTIKVTSNGNVTIPGLTAPAAGESKHVTLILEPPADTTYTLSDNNGDDLANGFDFGGSDLTVANPTKKLFSVVYDHDTELWKPVGVSA